MAPISTVVFGILGEIYYQWGQIEPARQHMQRALQLSTLGGYHSGMVNCRVLLSRHGIERQLLALHEHNEDRTSPQLVERILQGESLALISDAGTPLLSDPGYRLVRMAAEAGIPVVPVPGASAVTAALSVAGLPTDRFRFEGFPPRRQAARVAGFEALQAETATLVFYESAHRVGESLRDMAAVFGATRPAVLARELTKLHETGYRGTLDELSALARDDPNFSRGELVIVVAGMTSAPAARAGLGGGQARLCPFRRDRGLRRRQGQDDPVESAELRIRVV